MHVKGDIAAQTVHKCVTGPLAAVGPLSKHCYAYVKATTALTFMAAQKHCNTWGGYLVTLGEAAEELLVNGAHVVNRVPTSTTPPPSLALMFNFECTGGTETIRYSGYSYSCNAQNPLVPLHRRGFHAGGLGVQGRRPVVWHTLLLLGTCHGRFALNQPARFTTATRLLIPRPLQRLDRSHRPRVRLVLEVDHGGDLPHHGRGRLSQLGHGPAGRDGRHDTAVCRDEGWDPDYRVQMGEHGVHRDKANLRLRERQVAGLCQLLLRKEHSG
jgi:hypothetical protein